MANIRIDLNYAIKDGTKVVFRSPCDCTEITGMIVYYVEDGVQTSKEFTLADAHGENVGDIPNLFASDAVVKVILDVTHGMAFVQNADTNAYIERTFVKTVNGIAPDENGNVELGVETATPDWNAAEGEPGHIKNRTHWDDFEEVAFAEDKTVNKTGYTTVSWLTYDKVKDCTTARVIFNGVEYVCPVTVRIDFTEYGDESYFYIGNFQDGAPQYPFCFWGYRLNNFAIVNAEDGTHTVSIYGRKEVVHKLPEKYLPDYIKTVNGIAPDANGNVGIVVSGVSTSVEPMEDDIPKVFFGGALQQTKDEKVVPFRYISKTEDISGYAEIKAQGNSSMSYPKKNQTVKMFADEACDTKLKKDFKGWGKQNKHVYKANWIDLSHARNVVSARLWADVVKSRANHAELPELFKTTPNQGAVDGFPVKVYAAGVYQGRYTLNIPKDKWTFNMDDNLDNHCVLCGENYVSGCFRASANINGNDWTDEIHDTVPASIKTRWNEVISFVMNSTDEEFKANLKNYFFVDSLIDYYLFGLASCGLDAFGKNQIYATYDGQRWIASMYDMDSTWGLYWNGSKFVSASYGRNEFEDMVQGRQGNLLYMRLEQLFSAELQTRWEELKNGALSIENIINRFERFTDIAPAELVKEDYASTTGGGKFTGIPSKDTNNIQQIRAFALERQAWTDEYVAALSGESGDTGGGENPDIPEVPDHTHSYTSEVTTAATCTKNGVRTYTCECGASYTEAIPATGHNNVDGFCSVCGAEILDYTTDALSTATWLDGYSVDKSTGTIVANAGHYITEEITLQDCRYVFELGIGNSYATIAVYDADGEYLASYEPSKTGSIIFCVRPDYKYRVQVYTTSATHKNATLKPAGEPNNVAYARLELANLSWTISNNVTEAALPTDVQTSITGADQASEFVVFVSGSFGGAQKKFSVPNAFVIDTKYNVVLAPYFNNVDSAVSYFTENNTVLEFNKRYQ